MTVTRLILLCSECLLRLMACEYFGYFHSCKSQIKEETHKGLQAKPYATHQQKNGRNGLAQCEDAPNTWPGTTYSQCGGEWSEARLLGVLEYLCTSLQTELGCIVASGGFRKGFH